MRGIKLIKYDDGDGDDDSGHMMIDVISHRNYQVMIYTGRC